MTMLVMVLLLIKSVEENTKEIEGLVLTMYKMYKKVEFFQLLYKMNKMGKFLPLFVIDSPITVNNDSPMY